MLSTGAVGLAAFTGPPLKRDTPVNQSMMEMVESDVGVRMPAALLKASDDFKGALVEEEGVRYTVYRDVAGYPTVGVGHLIDAGDNLSVGDRIDEDQVIQFLESDLEEAERGVRQLAGNLPLHQHEFDALLDLVYNVGIGNVSERESPRLNAAIDAGDYEGIAAELTYKHAAGKVAKGLEHRSDRRANIFMEANYEDTRS
ncbi:lysozyme [Qipengyuania marisflavi]|uniref:Lysozyme n=2 Tax=Qipengyuania marisflavi TaxID=2486356 RepID=A0A5S3Q2B8_9SPHN|nr:lysozyme [Qipengyuania marisflavi]